MATYASEILNSDDYRNAIKEAMAKDCRYEDEHDGFENFSADSDHWLVISEMLGTKDTLITELVGALENAKEELEALRSFYGQGLMVAEWHQNGDLEPLDSFFESNDCGALDAVNSALSKAKDQTNDR